MNKLTQETKTNLLLEFILEGITLCTPEEFSLTVFFLTALIFRDDNKFVIYMNELLEGIDLHPDEYHRINVFRGIKLTEKQVLDSIEEINQKGVIYVEPLEGSNYQFTVSFVSNYEN